MPQSDIDKVLEAKQAELAAVLQKRDEIAIKKSGQGTTQKGATGAPQSAQPRTAERAGA